MTGNADILVIGSGVAGLAAALKAAEKGADVTLVTGGALLAGSSPRAQGGVAAAVGEDDAPALHAEDTFAVGAGLNDRDAVNVLVREGPQSVQWLLDHGMPFDGAPGHPDLGLEAGHGRRRILHAGGAATGNILTRSLLSQVAEHPSIKVREHVRIEKLLKSPDSSRVIGARSNQKRYISDQTILTTGGYGGLWNRTTNAPETRGSGVMLAWDAGASLADLEFVQFHPTALNLPGEPAFLLSEALRGEGAKVVDRTGREIVEPLLPRDVLARALHKHIAELGPVYLSLRHLDPIMVRSHFVNLAAVLEEIGLDITRDLLPIAPAAHYCMGGVRSDSWGRTDLPGLYTAGEVSCTGVQGANRLASNSLLECLVFGSRAARAALEDAPETAAVWATTELPAHDPLPKGEYPYAVVPPAVLGARLDCDVAVERDAVRLGTFLSDMPAIDDPQLTIPTDLALSSMIAGAAFLRKESRGAHYRTDAPETDPAWRGRILWKRGQEPRFERVTA